MAWEWYLNLEPIALAEAKEHAAKMTDINFKDNYLDCDKTEREPDDEQFLNNLRNGFISCVLASCYFESSVNALLRDVQGFDPEGEIIRGAENLKLEILFHGKEGDLRRIRSDACWRDYGAIKKVRNALVHYKNNCANSVSSYPPIGSWSIGGKCLASFFTKGEIERHISSVEKLISLIAESFGYEVTPEDVTLTPGARFGDCSYFCTKEKAELIRMQLRTDAQERLTGGKAEQRPAARKKREASGILIHWLKLGLQSVFCVTRIFRRIFKRVMVPRVTGCVKFLGRE